MSDKPDLSSLFEMMNNKGFDINSLMQNLSKNSNASSNDVENTPSLNEILYSNSPKQKCDNSSNQTKSDFQMPDMETIMKIMKIVNSINSNVDSPSANLLYSLKPFLRDSKKEKVDQYVKFLQISSVLAEINKSGGDFK